uniref:Kinesin-like protein KIN-14K n=1 Tax=Dermatophagoides pteronyssinus TaxID=6956 RepID=A0A6P6Y770_DERPT
FGQTGSGKTYTMLGPQTDKLLAGVRLRSTAANSKNDVSSRSHGIFQMLPQ